MGTVKGGRIICDVCGKDCTRLYGMRFDARRNITYDSEVQAEFAKVDELYGKHEFVFCWICSIKAFGMKTLSEKKDLVKNKGIPEYVKDDIEKENRKLEENKKLEAGNAGKKSG